MIIVGPPAVRGALVFLCAVDLLVGVWALFLPEAFYGSFPGFGREWIPPTGPYNEHLVRDVGALNLALSVLALIALARPSLASPRAVGLATLAYNLPHFVFHLFTLGMYGRLDQLGNVATLGTALLASGVLAGARFGRGAAPAQ